GCHGGSANPAQAPQAGVLAATNGLMRLFVAIGLPHEAAGELDEVVAPLRPAWPELRWTGRDAWHLTLAFLGEVDQAVIARLAVRLERAARRHPSLSLHLSRAAAPPSAP